MGWMKKVSDFARKNPDKVERGIDKAARFANERTGGKHGDRIAKGVDSAKRALRGQGSSRRRDTRG